MSDSQLLVPVSPSETLRQTVEYATRTTLDSDGATAVRFVYVHPAKLPRRETDDARKTAEELLDRVSVWAREDADEAALTVETTQLGADRYIFSPTDLASALAEEARVQGIQRVLLDPEYDPGIGAPLVRPLEDELAAYDAVVAETAPSPPQTRRAPLLDRASPAQAGTLFLVSFGFYQVLAGNLGWVAAHPADWVAEIYWLDVVTGTVSASVVSVALSQIALSSDPTRQTLGRLLRGVVYAPYLLKGIVRSNIVVAAVILNPRLPVEPRLTRIRPALWSGAHITLFANSVTLTPGTLTVRVNGRNMLVHSLVPSAREDLLDGGLERAVRFLFYGRASMRVPGLRERGEADTVAPESISTDDTDTAADLSADDQSGGESG